MSTIAPPRRRHDPGRSMRPSLRPRRDRLDRLMTAFSLVLIAACPFGPRVAAAETPPDPLRGFQGETYKTIGDVTLMIHRIEPDGHTANDRRPAAVFFFGGGWNSGTVAQFAPHCRYLASRGMVGFVADYRVASRHQTTPFDAVTDGKSAVRWIRSNAHRLGVDPDRIAAGGGSAGGHIAAAIATVPGLETEGEDTSISSIPNALLLFNPVYDNGPGGYGHNRVKERFREISPMHNIRPGIPPAIVFLGTNDGLVPVETAREFRRLMRDAGSRSELFLYEGQPHGFFNHPEFRSQASPVWFHQTMTETDRFLTSLGYLTGEPTLTAPSYSFELQPDEHLDISFGGKRLARYMFARDPSTPERHHETYKPYLHVFGKDGETPITKGPGGQFTHHRGIFLGYNRIRCQGNRYDLWHMSGGVQAHQRFLDQTADTRGARFTSEILWLTDDGETLLREERTFSFLPPPDRADQLIEMHSRLTAVLDDIELNGDPEHAGAQFRPANDVVRDETVYTFHTDQIDPRKDLDLPWVGETFLIGKQRTSVIMLNHPSNPSGTRFSAYRDYGRFGAFPVLEIAKGDTVALRYRWIVSGGPILPAAAIDQARDEFVSTP